MCGYVGMGFGGVGSACAFECVFECVRVGLGVPSENSVNFWSHRALGEGALK